MANSKQPSICCCLLPRAGIMIYTFSYTMYSFSGIVIAAAMHILMKEFMPAQDLEKEDNSIGLASIFFKWESMANILCGFIYAYAFILAYKRKWKSFELVLNAFLVIALYGAYLIFDIIKGICMMAFRLDDSKLDQIDSFDEEKKKEFKKWFPLTMFVFALVSDIIPWLIQVYLIKQTRSYIKYVLYKKDEKPLSSSSE